MEMRLLSALFVLLPTSRAHADLTSAQSAKGFFETAGEIEGEAHGAGELGQVVGAEVMRRVGRGRPGLCGLRAGGFDGPALLGHAAHHLHGDIGQFVEQPQAVLDAGDRRRQQIGLVDRRGVDGGRIGRGRRGGGGGGLGHLQIS